MIIATQRLISREYGIPLTGFGAAIIGGVIVGKVVLITDNLPFINKFPSHPLIYNIVWKSNIYFFVTLLFRYLEHLVSFLHKGEDFMTANQHLIDGIIWPHFWLIQMWLAVLFFIYCSLRELIRVIGKQEILRLFFGMRNS